MLWPGCCERWVHSMEPGQTGAGTPDYFPCNYGGSRLMFRGPRRDLGGDYIVTLGGSETFGRFVPTPFPLLLERRLGTPVVNLACVNAGPDLWLQDEALAGIIGGARFGVLQVLGALNLSNRYYTVHPRRNDRFIAASPLLRALYADLDLTEIHFTRHLVQTLHALGADRFRLVAEELRNVWLQRMTAVLRMMPEHRVLYWIARRPPPLRASDPTQDPALVDHALLEHLRPLVDDIVIHVPGEAAPLAGPSGWSGATGALAHREGAALLSAAISRRLI